MSVVLSALSFPSVDGISQRQFPDRWAETLFLCRGTGTPSQQLSPSINEGISLCCLSVQHTSVNIGGSVSVDYHFTPCFKFLRQFFTFTLPPLRLDRVSFLVQTIWVVLKPIQFWCGPNYQTLVCSKTWVLVPFPSGSWCNLCHCDCKQTSRRGAVTLTHSVRLSEAQQVR